MALVQWKSFFQLSQGDEAVRFESNVPVAV